MQPLRFIASPPWVGYLGYFRPLSSWWCAASVGWPRSQRRPTVSDSCPPPPSLRELLTGQPRPVPGAVGIEAGSAHRARRGCPSVLPGVAPPRAAGRERCGAPGPVGTRPALARPPSPLPGRPGRRSPSFWAALLLVLVWDPLSCVIPRWRGEPVPGNCARLLLAPLERVWERRCLGAAVSFWPPLLPRVPNPVVSPVTRPVGLPPVAHSPLGCLPKCLRDQEPRSVPRAQKTRRQQQKRQNKKLSGRASVLPDRVP